MKYPPNLTPQQVVEEMHTSDMELEELARQFAWFKGQRDYWKDQYDLALAKAKIRHNREVGKYGGDAAALVAVSEQYVQIPWLPEGNAVTLPDLVRITEASFDLIAKAYNRMETHIGILQSVNKNIMQDYGRANALEYT